MIFNKLIAFVATGVALILGVGLGVQTWRLHTAYITLAAEQVSIANVRTKAASDLADAQAKHREIEQSLNISASQIRKATDDQILVLNNQRSSLLDRVRLAEARAIAPYMPKASTTPSAGTVAGRSDGTELLGSFGSEDVEEATRAETIRLHLKACYSLYNRSAEALSK